MFTFSKTAFLVANRLYSTKTMKALVFLATGAEEMEFVISVDVLRRAGITVTVAGLPDSNVIKCSRGVLIKPDLGIGDLNNDDLFDALVLPGGLGGAKMLAESEQVGSLLKQHELNGKLIAAICAAPTALQSHNIGKGKRITSYPSVEASLREGEKYVYETSDVVVDKALITSRGPGTAYKFALAIVENLMGKDVAQEVAKGMLINM